MRRIPRSGTISNSLQVVSLTLAAAACPVHAQTSQSQAAEQTTIDEVLVTARRREETLQDVPSSVSAFDSTLLESKGVTDLRALSGIIPNVNVQFGTTSSSSAQIFLRGVGIDNTGFNIDPSVGVYIDDIFVGRLIGSNVNAGDIERIEVLRGPQGTLYGRSSTAGAIKYVTRKPKLDDLQTRLAVTLGNYDRRDFKASLNLPLVTDKLGLLLSAQKNDRDGYMKLYDANGNDTGKRGNGRDLTDVRAALRYQPTPELTLDLAGDYSRDDSGLQALTPVNCGATPAEIAARGQVSRCPLYYPGQPYASFIGPFPFDEPEYRTHGIAGTVSWDLGAGTLKSVSGYRSFDNVFASSLFGAPPPATQVNLRDHQEQHQFQQELQFTSAAGEHLSYITGLFYYREKIDAHYATQVGTLATIPYRNEDSQTSDSYAVYGEVYIRPIQSLELTVGGRYSWDEREVDRAIFLAPPYDTAAGSFSGDIDSTDFSPKLGVSYDFGPAMVYATYAEGYRPPGYINTSPRNPADLDDEFPRENEKSYEVGFKSAWFDERFIWNLAAFSAKYKNFEATLTIAGNTIAVTSDAKIKGIESEMTWRPLDGLSLYGNVALLSNKYTRPPEGQPFARKLKHAPGEVYSAGGDYSWSLGSLPGTIFVGGDATWTSATFRNVANTIANRSDSYTLISARAGYRSEDERWSLTLGGTNLKDEEYWMLGTQNRGLAYQPPREYYATIAVTF